jgi:hypothetical protein
MRKQNQVRADRAIAAQNRYKQEIAVLNARGDLRPDERANQRYQLAVAYLNGKLDPPHIDRREHQAARLARASLAVLAAMIVLVLFIAWMLTVKAPPW